MLLLLLGDSDIDRWPDDLIPCCTQALGESQLPKSNKSLQVEKVARGGATLSDVKRMFERWATSSKAHLRVRNGDGDDGKVIVVACAGENDLGFGNSIEHLSKIFCSLLDSLMLTLLGGNSSMGPHVRIIFLGPKYEPILTDDHSLKKQYTKLSKVMKRICDRHAQADRIQFLDCLVMFCDGKTKDVPGATSDGRAIPNEKLFDEDKLHLNDDGYRIWKREVENRLTSDP